MDRMILEVKWSGGNEFKLLKAGNYLIEGSCNRCGKCCEWAMMKEPCKHLQYETLDGQKRAVCGLYPWWPIGCALWPMPRDAEDIPEGCGFSIIKE